MLRPVLLLLALSSSARATVGENLLDPHYGDAGRNVIGFLQSDTPTLRALARSPSGNTWMFADDVNARSSLYVSRSLPNGLVDGSFGPANDGRRVVTLPPGLIPQVQAWSVTGALVQADGKPVVFGGMEAVNAQTGAYPALVCRLTVAGTFDAGFGTNGCRPIRSFLSTAETCRVEDAKQTVDGTLVVVGGCKAPDLAERPFVARLTAAGNLDTEFGAGAGLITPLPLPSVSSQHYKAVQVRSNSFIAVLGQFRSAANNVADVELGVLQFDAGGSPDTGFSGDGVQLIAFDQGGDNDDLAVDLALLPDGNLLVLGETHLFNPPKTMSLLARLTPAGQLDNGFGSGGKRVDDDDAVLGPNGSLHSLKVDSLGRPVVGGSRVIGQPKGFSAAGTEFWVALPASTPPQAQPRLLISSDVDTSGDVINTASGFSFHFNVQAGQMKVVMLPETLEMAPSAEVTEAKALHITAAAPIVVSELHGRTFDNDGTRVLTMQEIGTSYRVMAWHAGLGIGSTLSVAATQPNTTVTITPRVTTAGHAAGVPFVVALQPEQVYQLAAGGGSDLSGSTVTADKPIVVYGGHSCGNVPNSATDFCEMLNEQQLPVDRWGRDFLLTPFGGRTSANVVRVLADRPGTYVTLDDGTTASLAAGQFFQFETSQGRRIHATEPVSVAQFQKGCKDEGTQECTGDPTMLTILPVDQWQSRFDALVATQVLQGPSYLGIVLPTSATGSVTINTLLVPPASFTPIGTTGYSSAQVPVNAGAYIVASAAPMTVYVYSFPGGSAFAYPAAPLPLASGPGADVPDADDVIVRHLASGARDTVFGIGGIAILDHQLYYGTAEPSFDALRNVLVESDNILVGTASRNGASQQQLLMTYRLLGDILFKDGFE